MVTDPMIILSFLAIIAAIVYLAVDNALVAVIVGVAALFAVEGNGILSANVPLEALSWLIICVVAFFAISMMFKSS